MGRPEGHAFGDLRDDLPIIGLALLEAEFQADLVVGGAALGQRGQQGFGLNAPHGVEFRRKGPVPALVHQRLLDVDDRTDARHGARPGIGVVIGRVGAGHVAVVDIGHHPHRDGHARRRDPVLQGHRGGNRLAEFAPDAHRLPEEVIQPGGASVVGDLGPALQRDIDQRLAAGRIVVIAPGEDRELRAHRPPTQFGGDVGEGLEPVDIVAPHLGIGMAEMVEPPVRPGHAAGDAHPGALQRGTHLPGQAADQRRGPRGIDEFMRQLQVADADVARDRVDQVIGISDAVDQRVGVQRKRQHRRSFRPREPDQRR